MSLTADTSKHFWLRILQKTPQGEQERRLSSLFFGERLILLLSVIILSLSYIAEVSNSYLPGKWRVGCCGKTFWWSPVGSSLILVAAALALQLRRAWGYVATVFLASYTFCFFANVAIQRWLDYYPVDKGYALRQSLLPLYRPSGTILSFFIACVAVTFLFQWNRISKRIK